MEINEFIAAGPHAPLFESTKLHGERLMRYMESVDGKVFETNYKAVKDWFDLNLGIASDYVKWNTTIKCDYVFKGHNFLANSGPIKEQIIHTDYLDKTI